MRRVLTDGGPGTEFWEQFPATRVSAWRFEQQRQYALGYEAAQFQAFLDGHPESPMDNPELGSWMRQVAAQTAAGMRVGRVRIVDEPLSDYQRWMRWMDHWNREAGETIDYLARRRLDRVGPTLRPRFAPNADWWLLDAGTPAARLVLMHFDAAGVRVRAELSTDTYDLSLAEMWRDLLILAARAEERPLAA